MTNNGSGIFMGLLFAGVIFLAGVVAGVGLSVFVVWFVFNR